jgi:predicted component of type VI protein secretion system
MMSDMIQGSQERARTIRKEDARYKPYVLKRLTDFDPYEKKEASVNVITSKQVKEDVFENIDMLFNSRSHPSLEELKGYEELENSVLGYGISDYCGKICTREDREELRLHIIKQLKDFEPRLAPDSVNVEFTSSELNANSLIELRISGIISVGLVSEEVLFISRLDLETGNAELKVV